MIKPAASPQKLVFLSEKIDMDYIALYRKWRPMTFDEVVEQENVVTILKNTVKSRRIAHAYLFSGTRGTGKTSVAKIFSRAINCLNPVDGNPCNQCEICRGILSDSMLDVSEIDAASNNGIDAVRDIIDVSSYQASRAEYKVFIIDEVHMLSTSAFNALLKTLEEPPEKVVFILATTEPQKLPVTILSRCQRYNFMRISRDGIVARLEEICEKTGLEYESAALKLIAAKADGGLRDAISMLDQTIAFSEGKITVQDARKAAGAIDSTVLEDFTGALLSRDSFKILTLTDDIFAAGVDASNFIGELIGVLRSLMICLSTRNPKQFLYESDKDIERLKKLASFTNTKEITMLIRELSALENRLKWSIQRKIVFEAGILSLCDRTWSKDNDITDRIETLEKGVADLVNNGLKLAPGTVIAAPAEIREAPAEKAAAPEPDEAAKEDDDNVDLTRDILNSLEPVDKALWKEFIAAVREQFPGVAGVLSTRINNAYIIGRSLYILLEDSRDFKTITDGKRKETLTLAAARAFNAKLNVKPMTAESFFEEAPELLKSGDSDEEEQKNDADRIAEFAESNGIAFELEDFPGQDTPGTTKKEDGYFDASGFEPNADYSAVSYSDSDNDYSAANVPPPPEDEEPYSVVIPQPIPDPEDFSDDDDRSFDGESMYGSDEED